jgi:hypothetical protein
MIVDRAGREKVSVGEAWRRMEEDRLRVLDAQRDDVYRYALEPSIWLVSDALEDFGWCTVDTERMLERRFGWTWKEFKKRMREHLGFDKPVTSILDTGAMRSSKSWRAVKRAIMTAANLESTGRKNDYVVMMVHETQSRSRIDQQSLFWELLPPEWRMQIKSETAWIHYSSQNGFSNDRLILPNLVQIRFLFYTQDVKKSLEGAKPIRANLDEAFDLSWLETMERRCSQFNGVVHATFTPAHGWTDGISAFIDGAEAVKTIPGYLLPKDGGEALPWLAMGLTEKEWEELESAEVGRRPPLCPQSRPQDCLAWLDGKEGLPDAPEDREFERVARVMKSAHGGRAVVCYMPCDNPYSHPRNLLKRMLQNGAAAGREQIKRAVYSMVTKGWKSQFTKFDVDRHVCSREDVPVFGTNYMLMDPASSRNDFMLWIRVCGAKVYVYREWPGEYFIPGVGVPEEWAVPSTRNSENGNDGMKGGAQAGWGFSLLRMKFEMARLEGWEDYKKWSSVHEDIEEVADWDELRKWEMGGDDDERVEMRYVDSRNATMEKRENERISTLYTDLLDIGLNFELAPANQITDGVKKINSALEEGTLVICRECKNTIWSMRKWTGADGQRGACKEPIDCLRWFYDLDLATHMARASMSMSSDVRATSGGWLTNGERANERRVRQEESVNGGVCFIGR